jgi:hypothetical protein
MGVSERLKLCVDIGTAITDMHSASKCNIIITK